MRFDGSGSVSSRGLAVPVLPRPRTAVPPMPSLPAAARRLPFFSSLLEPSEVPPMFRIDAGRTAKYCDGLSRRSFLQLGVAGMASLTLAQVLRAREASAALTGKRKDTAVIL